MVSNKLQKQKEVCVPATLKATEIIVPNCVIDSQPAGRGANRAYTGIRLKRGVKWSDEVSSRIDEETTNQIKYASTRQDCWQAPHWHDALDII